MKDMSNTLSQLVLNIGSDEKYNDKKNQLVIEDQMRQIASASHSVNDQMTTNRLANPSIQVLASQLAGNAQDAYLAFHSGNHEYARALIRATINSCIACHTLNHSGPQFPTITANLEGLNTIEQARFFTATRQFDRAILEYRKILSNDQILNSSTPTWEEALHEGVNIAIRVKRDPKLAIAIVSSVVARDGAPYYMRDDALEWKKSLESWKPKKLTTEKALYSEALRLFALAKTKQKFGSDHSSDVLYIIASATLSDLLAVAPNGPHASEALMMEGICSESIRGPGSENLPVLFYEECIAKSPHSKVSQTCYHQYEQQIYQGYHGSVRNQLPEGVKQKDAYLRTLAYPE
jgi:hypothetical protein